MSCAFAHMMYDVGRPFSCLLHGFYIPELHCHLHILHMH